MEFDQIGPLLALLALFFGGSILVLFTSRLYSQEEFGVQPNLRETSFKRMSKKSGNDLDAADFTIVRKGYDALPFVGPKASDIIQYKFLEKKDAIIEPRTKMEIVYSGSSSSTFTFEVTQTADGKVLSSGTFYTDDSYNSDYIKATCNPRDDLTVTISSLSYDEDSDSMITTGTIELDAYCTYVRRELRSLTDSDLSDTLDAMVELWETSEEDGQKKYGDDYHSISYFAGMHDFNAAWLDADHIHEGLGFLLQHIKITNLFEQSMQAVDPSVSLFYWDFTIDSASEDTSSIFDSPMFTNDVFGKLEKPKDESWGWMYKNDDIRSAHVRGGRWKKIKADLGNSQWGSGLENGFGYMRGPWNMNPSPYVTRFSNDLGGSLPTCSNYYEWLGYTDFSDFMQFSSYAPHAATHGNIGGVFGCDMLDDMLSAGYISSEEAQLQICNKWGFYLKELYRDRLIVPNLDCSTSSNLDFDKTKCGFTCSSDDDSEDEMIAKLQSLSLASFVPDDMSSSGWTAWRDFFCTGNGWRIFVGDQLESASPSDPSFWPIHPTQERALQLKYMAGGFDDFTWPTDASGAAYVCNHAKCYDPDNADRPKDYYPSCCYGHYEYDQLMDFVDGDRKQGFGPTNAQILLDVNPRADTYAMNYIYEHFSFSHCSEDFDGLVNTLYDTMSRRR